MDKQYWVQDEAPDGSFRDSFWLDPSTTEDQAVELFERFRQSQPEYTYRLVVKIVTLVRQ